MLKIVDSSWVRASDEMIYLKKDIYWFDAGLLENFVVFLQKTHIEKQSKIPTYIGLKSHAFMQSQSKIKKFVNSFFLTIVITFFLMFISAI